MHQRRWPRITRDQGTWIYWGWMKNSYLVLREKTLCNCREGVFSEQADEAEGDSGLVKNLTAHWALLRRYDRAVSTVQLCTLICAYGTWTPLPDAPHISERK